MPELKVMYFNKIPYIDMSTIGIQDKTQLDIKVIDQGKLLDYMQNEFTELIKKNIDIANLVSRIKNSNYQAIIFGGWARDRIFEFIFDKSISFRDIDLVIDGDLESKNTLNNQFTKNDFGGLEFKSSVFSIDAWNLAETFLIKKNKLPISFETLPLTADFIHNAVVFFPAEIFGFSRIVEAGSINAINNLHLDFKAPEIPFPEMQVVRILVQSNKLNLAITQRVDSFLRKVCNDSLGLDYFAEYLRKYCTVEERKAVESRLLTFFE